MIYQKMLSRSNYLEEKIQMLKTEIANLPDGKICCVHESKRVKWMYKKTDTYKYIRKKDRSFAEKLAQKKYLEKLCSKYQSELYAINLFLKHYKASDDDLAKMLSDPAYQELLHPFLKLESKELEEWQNEVYEKNLAHPENLIYPTSSGNVVRSKSEALIDLYLFTSKIPFRYECALELNGTVIYPDVQLITTFETRDVPLTTERINQIIQQYFVE